MLAYEKETLKYNLLIERFNMASYPDSVNPGQFVGTTQVYDLGKSSVNAEDFTVHLRNNFNNIVLSLNAKVSGYYSQEEFINGKIFYPDYSRSDSATSTPPQFRQVYSKVVETGALPNAAGTVTVPHNISGYPAAGATTFIFTRIVGCATDQTNRNAFQFPYSNPTALADSVAVDVIGPNVVIRVGKNRSTFNRSHVYLEYIKY